MRLIVLCHGTPVHLAGGMETHAEATARAASELGHEVVVITTAHPRGLPEETRDGLRVEYLAGTPPGMNSRIWWQKSAEAVRRLRSRGFGDVILSLSLAGYGLLAAGVGVPHYVIAFGKTLSHLISEWHNWSGPTGLVAYPKRALALFYYAGIERRLWARADGIVATYDALYEELRREGRRAFLSYNGTDPRQYRPDPALREATRRALGIPADGRVLLMVGTVSRQKGTWVGVEAFRRPARDCSSLYLVVVGDGPDRARLEAESRAGGLERRLSFVGAVGLEATAPYFAAADVLLYPTFRMEGLPNAIVQAMAAGLPVVASDRGGIRSAVRDGETGFLLSVPTVEALAGAVGRLLSAPNLMAAMGRRARERAVAAFDMRILVARLLQELQGGRAHESR